MSERILKLGLRVRVVHNDDITSKRALVIVSDLPSNKVGSWWCKLKYKVGQKQKLGLCHGPVFIFIEKLTTTVPVFCPLHIYIYILYTVYTDQFCINELMN